MRKLTFALILIAALAFTASATPPPAYGSYVEGWGLTPCPWTNIYGDFYFWGIFNPVQPCFTWNVSGYCNPEYIPVEYPVITLELWVEMYAEFYLANTVYQWHRLGNSAETICFTIGGWIKSNSPQLIALGCSGPETAGFMYFRHDVAGHTGAGYGSNLPITWEGRVYPCGTTPPAFSPLTLNICGGISLETPKCDQCYEFHGCFDLPYHVDDGYYSLSMATAVIPVF